MCRQSLLNANNLFALLILLVTSATVLSQSNLDLEYEINEEIDLGTEFGDVYERVGLRHLYGIDEGDYSRLTFTLHSHKHPNLFEIHPTKGILSISDRIDRENLCPYEEICSIQLDIGVMDTSTQNFTALGLTVKIHDVNDNSPHFYNIDSPFSITVSESSTAMNKWPLPTAIDLDFGINSVNRYEILDDSGTFTLESTQDDQGTFIECYLVLIVDGLDRETIDSYSVKMVASDGGDPIRSSILNVNILVSDINDHTPEFTQTNINLTVSEDTEVETTLTTLVAHDPDLGSNGFVVYSLGQNTASRFGKTFAVNNISGNLILKKRLNYEDRNRYDLRILARDQGVYSRAGFTRVVITVINVNDHAPVLGIGGQIRFPCDNEGMPSDNQEEQCLWAEIAENNTANGLVVSFTVDDGDGDEIECHINNSKPTQTTTINDDDVFTLRQIKGGAGGGLYALITNVIFDREDTDKHLVMVECIDNGNPPMTSRTRIIVNVTDINDNSPVFERHQLYAEVTENNPLGTILTPRLRASDRDVGDNAYITYALDDSTPWLHVNRTSGVLTVNAPLDYESAISHTVRLTASDQGNPSLTSTAYLYVTVIDVNDEVPRFDKVIYKMSVEENKPSGTVVGRVRATDADITEAFSIVEYYLTSSSGQYFTIERTTGIIKTGRPLDREKRQSYSLLVSAKNPNQPYETGITCTVKVNVTDVNDNPPYITYPIDVINAPNKIPKGYAFAHVQANDLDEGQNSVVTFKIAPTPTTVDLYPESFDLFYVDSSKGLLSVTRKLDVKQHTIFTLLITVHDNGVPQLNSSTDVSIIVNASVSLPIGGARDDEVTTSVIQTLSANATQTHTIVIICMGVLTFVFVVILLIAIFMVRRNQPQCENEGSVIDSPSRDIKTCHNTLSSPGHHQYDPTDDYDPATIQRQFTTETFRQNNTPRKRPMDNTPSMTGDGFGVKDYKEGDTNLSTRPVAVATYRQVNPSRMSQLLVVDGSEPDSPSECSGDSSNTDSGRGFSDDGDSNVHAKHTDAHSGSSFPTRTPQYRTVNPRRTPSLTGTHSGTLPQRRTPSMRLPPYNTPIPHPPPPPIQALQRQYTPSFNNGSRSLYPSQSIACNRQQYHPQTPQRTATGDTEELKKIRSAPLSTNQLTMLPIIKAAAEAGTLGNTGIVESPNRHKNSPGTTKPFSMVMDSEV